jgi:hypothetical protein
MIATSLRRRVIPITAAARIASLPRAAFVRPARRATRCSGLSSLGSAPKICYGGSRLDALSRRVVRSLSSTTSSSHAGLPKDPLAGLFSSPIVPRRIYRYLDLHQFTDEEFGDVFDKIVPSSAAGESEGMSALQLQAYLLGRIQELEEESEEVVPYTSETAFMRKRFVKAEVGRIWEALVEGGNLEKPMCKDNFCRVLREMATRVDFVRSLPIVTSMMIVGASVGVITPAMVSSTNHPRHRSPPTSSSPSPSLP